jgi:RimJ/RimL family protein N-acetyltransferase
VTTPEVSLRSLVPEDARIIAGWGDDPVFVAHADWTERSPAETLAFWESRTRRSPDGLIRLGADEDGALVGCVDLHGDEPDRRELGYVVGPRRNWGRGLGTAIATAGLSHAFDAMGLAAVSAEAYAANEPSVRILQRLGMTETGRGEDGEFLGQPTYLRIFAITAAQWRSAAGQASGR